MRVSDLAIESIIAREREELSRLFGQLVWARLLVVPFAMALVAWVLVIDPTPWRRAALVMVALFVISLFVFEFARYRRRGLAPRAIQLNLAAATVGQLAATAATGGIDSPFVYAALPITLLTVLFLGHGAQLALGALQLASLLAMAAGLLLGEKNLLQAAQGWVHNVVETDRAARELLGERYCALRYEDLLQEPLERRLNTGGWRHTQYLRSIVDRRAGQAAIFAKVAH